MYEKNFNLKCRPIIEISYIQTQLCTHMLIVVGAMQV